MGRVEVDDRLRPGHELDVVGRRRQVLGPEVAHRYLAALVEVDPQAPAVPVVERQPAGVGPAAGLLRPDVRDDVAR